MAGGIAPTTALTPGVASVRVLVGGHSRSHPYGPAVFSATLDLATNHTSATLNLRPWTNLNLRPGTANHTTNHRTTHTTNHATNHTINATLAYDFDVKKFPGTERMSVSSLVRSNDGSMVVTGLHVGDYYDGDVPRHLWGTENGGKYIYIQCIR